LLLFAKQGRQQAIERSIPHSPLLPSTRSTRTFFSTALYVTLNESRERAKSLFSRIPTLAALLAQLVRSDQAVLVVLTYLLAMAALSARTRL
jgi:hypothetical protein